MKLKDGRFVCDHVDCLDASTPAISVSCAEDTTAGAALFHHCDEHRPPHADPLPGVAWVPATRLKPPSLHEARAFQLYASMVTGLSFSDIDASTSLELRVLAKAAALAANAFEDQYGVPK